MKTKNIKTITVICAVLTTLTAPSISFCEDNPRQAAVQQSSGSKADTISVRSKNTIHGNVKATDHSRVTVGDVNIANVDADAVLITTKNEAKSISAKDHSVVAMGSVNVSDFKGGTVMVDTDNNVKGKVTAKDHSKATIGNVNIHQKVRGHNSLRVS